MAGPGLGFVSAPFERLRRYRTRGADDGASRSERGGHGQRYRAGLDGSHRVGRDGAARHRRSSGHRGPREHVSDDSGQLTLEELASNGVSVDIEAPGFLDRQTIVRRGEQTTFELWPSESPTRLDSDYTRALVYLSASLGDQGEIEPLDRPSLDVGRVAIVPTGAIPLDPRAMQTLRDAAAEMTNALGGAVVYSVGEDPGAVPITLLVEPQNESIVDENLRAFTRCWMTRLVITRCEIVFRDVEVARSNTTLHELGHTFGLNHSPDRSEVMGVRRVRSPEGFSPRERLAMTLMLKRLPGNLFPDNDRQAPALRALREQSRILCRHP